VYSQDPEGDYEILAVDDGSRDQSLELLRRLEKEIPQLRVFSKENGGPASARNFGIEKARGEYLLFCDSDDRFLSPGAKEAVRLCEEQGADLLIFGYHLTQEERSVPYRYRDCLLEKEKDWAEYFTGLYGANMLNQAWGKVFSTARIRENGILFPDALWGEDRLFFFQVLEKAERVAVSSLCFYDYIQQKNSLISRFVPEKCRLCETIHRGVCRLAKEKGAWNENAKALFSYMYVKSLVSAFATLYSPSCSLTYRQKRAYVREALRQESLKEVKGFPPESGRAFRLLGKLVLGKNVTLNLLAARCIPLASRIAPALLRRAKHAYNKEKGESL